MAHLDLLAHHVQGLGQGARVQRVRALGHDRVVPPLEDSRLVRAPHEVGVHQRRAGEERQRKPGLGIRTLQHEGIEMIDLVERVELERHLAAQGPVQLRGGAEGREAHASLLDGGRAQGVHHPVDG